MKMIYRLGLVGTCWILGALTVGAQAPQPAVQPGAQPGTQVGPRRVTGVIGSRVVYGQGQQMGQVTDVVFGDRGTLDYVIVTREGGQMVAVPWGAVRYQPGQRNIQITTRFDPERLTDLYFRQDRWPNFTTPEYQRRARTFWGDDVFRGRDIPRGEVPRDRP